MLNLYSFLTSAAYAASYPWLKSKYAVGFDERRGIYAKEKCLDNPIWVHAVSVGEVQAAIPFISEVKKTKNFPPKNSPKKISGADDIKILLSTTTQTGANFAGQMNAECDAHIYYPWDLKRFVSRALDSLKPRAYISVETEIWPQMLAELRARNIPAFLINGRISDKSFKRMSAFPSFWRSVFSCFTSIMVRDGQDARRLESLGILPEKISVTGDCKIDAMRERKSQCAHLQAIERSAPIFVAGSTHPGEEEQVIEAFGILRSKIPGAKLMIVPRHPERAREVGGMTSQIGATAYYSEFDGVEFLSEKNTWEFLIVDRIGVLFCLYGIAESVFIGGSLVPKGGQNLMEPALFGVPACHGQYMSDFRHVSDEFCSLGISKIIYTAEEIADFWLGGMDENFRRETARLSENWFAERGGAAEKCRDIILLKKRFTD
ncbi:MAG: 3-deoxy-D-manno-octulosonic acid transferase [Synergistaceae bacterium]|nr:3-deoxy-D-manno-octulosonic acid transferase [Synergistaceae bacterium]